MSAVQKTLVTPLEYLETEEKAQIKHDFVAGEVVAMTGGSVNHNLISGNLYLLTRSHLKGSECRAFIGDVRLAVETEDLFTYPDLMVVCGGIVTFGDREDTITNPRIIIEVLSKSTRDYDLGTKASAYRSLESLEELVFVDQYATHLEHWMRQGDYWQVRDIRDHSSILTLTSIGLELPLEEVYRDVVLT